ncbi:glutathione peroxidase [Jeotgalibaca sp. MA1X17-3]|uniref:glutathione peroxidase n=1 Tax=Jeotgalibaca sp. MA1X17-3 TaxID=2908211 RepID=UPI001F485E8C|nr:glutathione peroxidase [Jeotgalibaca sp. MA1X17-3]UJF16427.1 glutathione peroxidase [Jeotgalibaca sp. MA1X17-3]
MSVFDFTVQDLENNSQSLDQYRGDVLLIVNTATKCGLVGQLKGLEKLQEEFKDKGFNVLGFPSNQFMGQEPLDGMEIKNECSLNYGVTFPLFDKIKVNGSDASDLYKYLVSETGNKFIKWNYTKFLVDREGNVVDRFAPTTSPENIRLDIEKIL